jgi:hypothetical protein
MRRSHRFSMAAAPVAIFAFLFGSAKAQSEPSMGYLYHVHWQKLSFPAEQEQVAG